MIILKEIKNKSIKLLINERLDEEEKLINEEMNYHHKKEVSLYNKMNYHHKENFRFPLFYFLSVFQHKYYNS